MNTLPNVWNSAQDDLIAATMKLIGKQKFAMHTVLPATPAEWQEKRRELLSRLGKAICLEVNHALPLDLEVTGIIQKNGYRVEKLCFQAADQRYVTGCLYVPDGPGPFPAVLNVHGHWQNGHLAERVQSRGHLLALNGFVCLSVDAFGSGERSTVHGEFEPHGGPLGTLLNNLGETLIGIQIADNMRALDLLCSLPYVKADQLGVTGGSGGGNQTMYLAAFDDRIKAAVSVCSAGTWQACIMGPNCICETIPGGLGIAEEAGLIASIAPRAYAMFNGLHDQYSSFTPEEMLKTYIAARPVYRMMNAENDLQYRIFPTPHLYGADALSHMLGFFRRHLKNEGNGEPCRLQDYQPLSQDEAMVYPRGKRPDKVKGILAYCAARGKQIQQTVLSKNENIRRAELEKNLNCSPVTITEVAYGGQEDGWHKHVLMKSHGFPLPALLRSSANGRWRLLSAPYGKQQLAQNQYLSEAMKSEDGLLLFDLFASGETGAEYGNPNQWDFHNTGRTCFWLGWTLLGEWVRDYTAAANWLRTHYEVNSLTFYGYKDAAVASLISCALYQAAEQLVLDHAPVTLNWSNCVPAVNMFTLGLCATHILKSGDIPDFVKLCGPDTIQWLNPINADGTAAKIPFIQ